MRFKVKETKTKGNVKDTTSKQQNRLIVCEKVKGD